MRVAIYTRISTDEAHQPYSLEAQSVKLKAYVESQDNWHLVRSFTDQSSGAKTDRPGLQQALREARAGRFDLLLVYRVDRFSRSVRGLAQLLEDLDAANVAFRSATEPFDTTTPAGRMMVQMLAVFAEFERATIIDRIVSGMERKAARGEWTAGQRPFGYNIDRKLSQLVVNETEAPLVPIIFDLYGNKSVGARGVAAWLNERGHRTKAGRPWSHNAVLTVLRNRAYIGEVFFRDTYRQGAHSTLIDTELFERVGHLLAERGEDHAKRASNGSDYLLSSLIVCDQCGGNFVGGAATGRNNRYVYYTCCTRQRLGTKQCNADRVPADQLDEAILDSLLSIYGNGSLFDDAIEAFKRNSGATQEQQKSELTAVGGEIRKTEEAIERYLLAFENGTLTEDTCSERMRALGGKLADLRNRRIDIEDSVKATDAQAPSVNELADLRSMIGDAIKEGDTKDQKRLVQALVHEVRVHDRTKIIPVFRMPEPQADGVRVLSRKVGAEGLEPPTSAL
jgi:site-specific DNA recombinase